MKKRAQRKAAAHAALLTERCEALKTGKITGKEFVLWCRQNPNPKPSTGIDLVNELRSQAKEVLRRAGYKPNEIESIATGHYTITDADRKRDPKIAGSAGGFESAAATWCLQAAVLFEHAWNSGNFDMAVRYAMLAQMASERMKFPDLAAHALKAAQKKQAAGRKDVTAKFIKAAHDVYRRLPPKDVNKKRIWEDTCELPGIKRIEYSAFCANFRL